jgi:alpha-amylase
VLGSFADNHDTPRFLSLTSDPALYLNALTYTFTTVGIPIVYYGSEQGFHGGRDFREPLWESGFTNSSLYYAHIRKLNAWRKAQQAWATLQIWLAVADDLLAYTRGPTLVVLSNAGSASGKRPVVLNFTGLADGNYSSIWDVRDRVTVQLGSLTVQLLNGMPKVYVPAPALTDKSAVVNAE